jgi:DNA-binding CsgD family transcriptional regulator
MNTGTNPHIRKQTTASATETSRQAFWTHSPMNKPGPRGPQRRLTDRRRELIRRAYADERLVPLAIADKLGLSIRTVARYLRQLERAGLIDPIPPWHTLTAPDTPLAGTSDRASSDHGQPESKRP